MRTNDLFRDYLEGRIRCPRQARADHRKRIIQRAEQYGLVITEAMPGIIEAFERFSDAVKATTEAMQSAGLTPTPPPTDPRARALWAKQHQGHGPKDAPLRVRGRNNRYKEKP